VDSSVVPWMLVLGWASINVWMTRRVLRARSDYLRSRNLLVAGIWIFPVFGALAVRNHLKAYAFDDQKAPVAQPPEPSPSQMEAAPERVVMPSGESLDLAQHVHQVHGFPLFDWAAVAQWTATFNSEPAKARQAMAAARRAWLLHMRDVLGPQFFFLH
jgi:hypothetical protein